MFQLTIKTENAAFDELDGWQGEVSRILRELAHTIAQDTTPADTRAGGSVMDLNGNKVGVWSLK